MVAAYVANIPVFDVMMHHAISRGTAWLRSHSVSKTKIGRAKSEDRRGREAAWFAADMTTDRFFANYFISRLRQLLLMGTFAWSATTVIASLSSLLAAGPLLRQRVL